LTSTSEYVAVRQSARVPVEILTLNDIARYAAARSKRALAHEVTQTLAAIAEPRSHGSHAIQVLAPAELVAAERGPTAITQFAQRP
jgi:hypothetical protein